MNLEKISVKKIDTSCNNQINVIRGFKKNMEMKNQKDIQYISYLLLFFLIFNVSIKVK